MIKIYLLLIISIILIGCKQKEEGSATIKDTTSINESIILNDSTSSIKEYKPDEIISINRLAYTKKDSVLITGELKILHENGQVKQLKTFKDGKLNGPRKLWYKSGKIMQEGNYIDGKTNGPRTVWYENGNIRAKGFYKDGGLDGTRKGWWENGNIKTEMNYKNGKINGFVKSYNEDGSIKEEKEYKDGKPIN